MKNDFKAIKAIGKFRAVPLDVWPRPPPLIKKASDILPTPEAIHDLIFAKYAPDPKNSYERHLIQYLLLFDFGFGVRYPSEAHALRIQDFDPKTHTIVITEPKKSMRTRRLYIEPEWLCCVNNTASLAQYLRWRAKVNVGGSDRFFLKPDGSEFPSKQAITQWIVGRVRPQFPWYHGYLGRKWAANARLIEWDFDYNRVAKWLGHESVDMTRENYEQDARIHAKMYGKDWLLRALRGRQRTANRV